MNKIVVIAEAGVNHNGSIETAKKMARIAKECGADIVKFQTFHAKSLACGYVQMAAYQKENLGISEPQQSMLEKLALNKDEFVALAKYCKEIGIIFLSSPFDIDSVHFLNDLQELWKIPSGEITNYPYLVEIAKTGKPVILSTGMCTLDEVDAAVAVLKANGAGKITLLHCTTDYPVQMRDVNLKAMLLISEHCQCEIGYSDHTQGIEVAIAAVAMGAVMIEKHFTINKCMKGPDHKASLEPAELAAMIQAIRNVTQAMGNGQKAPTEMEKANLAVVRKSIIAAKDIEAGEIFTMDNLTTKRPGTGISPMRWREVIGLKAKRSFAEDELIEL